MEDIFYSIPYCVYGFREFLIVSISLIVFLSRQLVAWHRPFCVDLEESTFSYLRNFLESYCDGISNNTPPAPFLSKRYDISSWLYSVTIKCVNLLPQDSKFFTNTMTCGFLHTFPVVRLNPDSQCSLFLFLRDHHHFLLLCMKLLSIHLSLAHAGGTGSMVLGAQGRPLRNLLFRLIDTNMPDSIQQVSQLRLLTNII